MKLNRKGYMLVEIVVASVLAMTVAYYLLNLTYKFKNTNEDIYMDHFYSSQKNLVTKNIMNDLNNGVAYYNNDSELSNVSSRTYDTASEKVSYFEFDLFSKSDSNNTINSDGKRRIELKKDKNTGAVTIRYGKFNTVFDNNDRSYYEKKLEPTLIVGDLSVTSACREYGRGGIILITIPIKSIYNDTDYSIKLVIECNYYE